MPYKDPQKKRENARAYHLAHPEKRAQYNHKARHRNQAWVRRRRQKRRDWAATIKFLLGCAICGYAGHHAALELHHVRGKKLFSIGSSSARPDNEIETEVAKCDVLCANCHRIETFENYHKPKRRLR